MRYPLILLTLICIGSQQLKAQSSLTMDFGQNFTTLKFMDDQGNADTSIRPNFSTSFNVGYSYALDQGIFFSTKIGFRPAGASYVYDDVNYKWNMNYTEYRLGVGYAYDLGPVTARLSAQGYVGYLFKAEQQLHHLTRDMLAAESIEEWDLGLFITPGVEYPINDILNIGLNFNYMLGLYNIEVDEGQSTKNSLMGSNVSIRINL